MIRTAGRTYGVANLLLIVLSVTSFAGTPASLEGGVILSQNEESTFNDEIAALVSFLRSDQTMRLLYDDEGIMRSEYDTELTALQAAWIRRPAGLFRHRDLPFFFVPYNHREDLYQLACSRVRNKIDQRRVADLSEYNYSMVTQSKSDLWTAMGLAEHQFEQGYASALASYSRFDAAEGADSHTIRAALQSGYQSPGFRFGVGLDVWRYRQGDADTEETAYAGIVASATPSPFAIVTAEYQHLMNPSSGPVERSFELAAQMFLPGSGIEIGLRGFGSDGSSGRRRLGLSAFAGTHWRNGYARLHYTAAEYEQKAYSEISHDVVAEFRLHLQTAWLLGVRADLYRSDTEDVQSWYLERLYPPGATRMENEFRGRGISIGLSRLL